MIKEMLPSTLHCCHLLSDTPMQQHVTDKHAMLAARMPQTVFCLSAKYIKEDRSSCRWM